MYRDIWSIEALRIAAGIGSVVACEGVACRGEDSRHSGEPLSHAKEDFG